MRFGCVEPSSEGYLVAGFEGDVFARHGDGWVVVVRGRALGSGSEIYSQPGPERIVLPKLDSRDGV